MNTGSKDTARTSHADSQKRHLTCEGVRMTEGCRCGEQCARCGGCEAQHNTEEKREYLGCIGFIPQKWASLTDQGDLDAT